MNIVLPFSILAGFSANEILKTLINKRGLLIFAVDVAILMVCFLGYHAVKVSFSDYDNDVHPLTYVQTKRDFKKLVSRIEQVSYALPDGKGFTIFVKNSKSWAFQFGLAATSSHTTPEGLSLCLELFLPIKEGKAPSGY